MHIDMDPKGKSVHIWLTSTERHDASLQTLLQPMIRQYKARGFMPCIVYSGSQDMTDNTRELIRSLYHAHFNQ